MKIYEYGGSEPHTVLIQPVSDHDEGLMQAEINAIKQLSGAEFRMTAIKTDSWNDDLSPWKAPPVFGSDGFGGGAQALLDMIKGLMEEDKTYIIGGYSLAGLFALWAAYQTDVSACAAASPSVWFPGFAEYAAAHRTNAAVYLSLGDREAETRNPVMARVADNIVSIYDTLKSQGTCCTLEWNKGGHFKDAHIRTAKAFAWALSQIRHI